MAVDLSVAPYYDDYDEDKQFHRLLFRPGRAPQAREFTQLQTILQNQISRFGQNIFLEGSVVVPGGASIDTNYEYVKIDEVEFGAAVAGATVVGNSSGTTAQIIQMVGVEGSDPATLYIRYTGGGSSNGGRFQNGETLTWTNTVDAGGASGTFNAKASAATGTGTKVDLNKGIYFVRGYFAAATSQSLIVAKYGIPSGVLEIGLIVAESIVTSNDDSSLLDNANGSSNRNAPGADRLKYALVLTKREDILDSSGDPTNDYFTIVRLKDAVIVEQLTRTTYSILGDELARRTYDESGDYTVDPFIVSTKEHPTDPTKIRFIIDPGRAYVKGYMVDKSLPSIFDTTKALTTETQQNGRTATYFGNFIRVNNLVGAPQIDDFASVSLEDTGGVARGTARVRAIELESGSIYRLYLFEVKMNAGFGFNAVHQIDGATWTADLIDDSNAAVVNNAILYDTSQNTLLFRIPNARIQSIADITVRAQRQFTATTDASGNITLNTLDANVTFADTGGWIVIRNDNGAIITGSANYGTTGSSTITVTGLPASTSCTFYTYVDKTTATTSARSKTLTTVTDSVLTPNGDNSVDLGQFDIFELVSVKDASNSDADITARYRLDGGQRDNFYEEGRLALRGSATAPAGNVKVTFKYFSHGPGDYFNVNSYDNFIGLAEYSYGDIPSHTLANGTEVRLSEVFDFRPKKNNANTGFSGTGAAVNELPKLNETIQADVTYYLPRIDVLYLSSEGEFSAVKGNPDLNPTQGHVPSNVMPIYRVRMGAGTIDLEDVSLTFIENKRYTMRDIGAIERRIERVEEWSTLSALESNTQAFEVLDENGNNRFKSGFFVDNFQNHAFADFLNSEFRSSIDPVRGEVRPTFVENNSPMRYKANDSLGNASSGVVQKGDFLLLDYTEVVEISQPLASSAINVNPYSVITGTGGITLSPQTDEWRDVNSVTNRTTIQQERAVNPVQNGNWDNWRWNWAGRPTTEQPNMRPDFTARTGDWGARLRELGTIFNRELV